LTSKRTRDKPKQQAIMTTSISKLKVLLFKNVILSLRKILSRKQTK